MVIVHLDFAAVLANYLEVGGTCGLKSLLHVLTHLQLGVSMSVLVLQIFKENRPNPSILAIGCEQYSPLDPIRKDTDLAMPLADRHFAYVDAGHI